MVAGRWKLQRASRPARCSKNVVIAVVENVYRSYRRRRLRRGRRLRASGERSGSRWKDNVVRFHMRGYRLLGGYATPMPPSVHTSTLCLLPPFEASASSFFVSSVRPFGFTSTFDTTQAQTN